MPALFFHFLCWNNYCLVAPLEQTKVFSAKYIMKMDDDAFVRIDEVLSSLKRKTPNGLLYGYISFESAPRRERDNKWFVSDEVFM